MSLIVKLVKVLKPGVVFSLMGLMLNACQTTIPDVEIQEHRLEQSIIAQTNGRVWREGASLYVRAENGVKQTYISEYLCGYEDLETIDLEHCISYHLAGYLKDKHGILIESIPYEGNSYVWFDENTGREQILEDYPIFSPSNTRAIIMGDVYDYIGVVIYRFTNGTFAEEWSIDSGNYQGLPIWVDEENICVLGSPSIFKNLGSSYTSGETEPYEETFIHFYRRDDKWEVAPYWLSRAYCLVH